MADTKANGVKFTRTQVEYLNRMYPEVVGTHTTTEAEYRFRAGQRSVIALVNTLVDTNSREIE